MPVKLTIYTQNWKCPRREYVDDCEYPPNFNREKETVKKFRGYTDMANWLDKNRQFKNRVMIVKPIPLKRMSGIKKVVFDGIGTWVEKYGHI